MRVKNVRMSAAKFFLRSILDRFELLPRQSHRGAETTSLALHIGFRDMRAIHFASPFLQPQNTPYNQAVRHAKPMAAELLRCGRRFDVSSFDFIKIARKKTDYRIKRLFFVNTVCDHAQFRAATGEIGRASSRVRW